MSGSGEPGEYNSTEPVETVDLYERIEDLAAAVADQKAPAGRLLGLPELDDPGDCWVDIAGASVLARVGPDTIRPWLQRGQPKACPFPAPTRILFRLYWPASVIRAWRTDYDAVQGRTAAKSAGREDR